MRRLVLSVLLAVSACWATAQQNYGNEWINYDQRYWAFWVGTTQVAWPDPIDGFWRIDSATLANAGFPVASTDAQTIQVWGREHQVPICFPGDSDHVFNGTDFIEFYVPKNDAWLDTALWDDPAHINNPYYSAIGDSIQYFLTIGTAAESERVLYEGPGDWASLPVIEDWYWAESTLVPTWPFTYKRGKRDYLGTTTSYMCEGEGFSFNDYGTNGADLTVVEDLQLPWPWINTAAPPLKLSAVILGANSASQLQHPDHHLRFSAGTGSFNQVIDTIWTAEKTIKLQVSIPAGGYANPWVPTTFKLVHDLDDIYQDLPPDYPDLQSLSYLRAEYPHAIGDGTFPTQSHRMKFPNDGQDIRMQFYTNWDPVIYVFGDTVRRITTELANGGWKNCRLPYDPSSDTTFAYMSSTGTIRLVDTIFQVNGDGFFNDYGALNTDSALIIVTHPKLMNGALQYAQYRESSQHNHYNTVVANVMELYQQFGGGILRHPVAIRRFAKNLLDRFDTKPQGLFIIGKGTQAPRYGFNDLSGYRSMWPGDSTARKLCLVPSFGYPPSDALLTMGISGNDWDQSIPVGRLAAQTEQQVIDYKDKVQELEQQQSVPAAWMKNILHFRGGFNDNEVLLFQGALTNFQLIAEDTCFAGHVTQFVKNPDELISQASADSVYDLVEQGVTLMTFFAHASGGGFDISIDQPGNYQWNGRYPFMIGNSCYTGNIHLPSSSSGSEQFVLPAGAGAIAFLASNDLGVSTPLWGMTSNFYTSFSRKHYGSSIGRHIQYMDSVALFTDWSDITTDATVHQFTLHGDPTLKMNSPLQPDMEITPADVRLSPDPVTADVDSFQVRARVRNLGNACQCPEFPVTATRLVPGNNDPLTEATEHMDLNTFEDTVRFTLPVLADSGGAGINTLNVSVDLVQSPFGIVDEYEDLSNNEVSKAFLVTSGDLIPVDPFNFAITLDPAPVLQASTGDPFAPMRGYVFQIDTIDTYDSPMMEEGHVNAPGGVVNWQPPSIYSLNTLQDSLVYFWRCSVDSTGNDGFDWKEFSFQYIPGRKGWGQAHHMQFKDTSANNSFENLLHRRPERDFEFYTGARNVGAVVQGNSAAIVKWTKDLVTQEGSPGCLGASPSFMVAVIDPFDFTPWTTRWNGTGHHLGAINDHIDGSEPSQHLNYCWTPTRPYKAFQFPIFDPLSPWRDSLRYALEDSIPDGHYLLMYTVGFLLKDSLESDGIDDLLIEMGATQYPSLPDSVPYIFFCRKGFPGTAQEVAGTTSSSLIDFATFVDIVGNSGSMRAPRSAEMLLWNSLHWEIDPTLPTDSAWIQLRTVNQEENAEALTYEVDPGATTDSLWLDTIGVNSVLHPRIRLSGSYKSVLSDDPYPAQTKRWQIVGTPAPECAIDPPLGYFMNVDSLFEGQTARVMVAVHNISDVPMDSLLMAAWVTDEDNVRHTVHWERKAPLPVDGVVLDTISITLADGYAGMNALVIEANPVDTTTGIYDQREQYHFNNIATLRFETLKDRENPVLDVTFDGVHILDGDIVSAKPEIKMTLDDENTTLLFDDLSDTAQIKVFLLRPDTTAEVRIPFHDNATGEDIMQFIPTTGSENVCKVMWHPGQLADGVHRLRVQASDISRNESGSHDYTVKFEVINKPTITEVLNYPNPFTTSTRFVFTLTGSEVPTGMRIRIMTISGRVVREIMQNELGPLHIGRNITEYAWDGHDQFGDKLARGVYLYQVVAQLNGQDIEYRETSAGGYFTKGFGKMYLLR